MDDSRTQAREGGTNMAERYTGPSARRIADLLPHRVSYERGWFWTTTAICHGGRSDGLALRQRPDGEGVDVRCHTGGCSRGVVLTHLESLVGLPMWTAYEPVSDAAAKAPEKRPWWKRKRVVVAGVVALVVAAPLITGDVEVFALNLVGLVIGACSFGSSSRGARCRGSDADKRGRLLSHTHANTQGSSPSGDGPSSLPARAQSKTKIQGGRDDNGNIGNWQSDDGDGGKAPAQPRRAGRPAHGGAVLGAAGDGTGDGDTERGQERPRGAAAQAGG